MGVEMLGLKRAQIVTFIMTKNLAAARDFYANILGLEFAFADDFGAVFNLNGASLRLTEIGDYTPSPHPAIGFEIPNIIETIKTLNAKNVKMEIYEGFGQDELGIWHSDDGKSKLAWFKDVDGNVLCLKEV
jgi:catechol 2,3-dioxygenase-like lactoylglutathione lyase family enzyme